MNKYIWMGSAAAALAAFAWDAPLLAQNQEEAGTCGEGANCGVSFDTDPDPIIVSASRAPEGVKSSVAPITAVVSPPKIASIRQTREVADALRDFPSVAVSSVAGQTQIRLRG